MRQEDKEVDGPELEKAEERKRENELIEDKDDELYDLDGKPYEPEQERERSGSVVAAMRMIFEREHIVINDLKLPQRELKALEALNTAVRGKSGDLDKFVYAEDRRALLEQALAVLQPDLVSIEKLGEPFEQLMKDVSGLRTQLNDREDAEEEVIHRPEVEKKAETDSEDDKDDKDYKDDKDDDDKSLTGPERKVEKPKSSLAEGKDVKPAEKKATSLGDPKEIEQAAKALPFWKKPSNG